MNFVSFEIAQKLKEKGYPIKRKRSGILGLTKLEYIDELPTISQVLKWLREEKSLHVEVVSAAYGYKYIISDTPNKGGTDRVYSKYRGSNDGGAWDDYNECIFDAIEYVIDNLI